jgi:general secretion pathway protein D
LVGQEVPVSTGEQLSANFENAFRTVQRQEVGIKLEVTPQVNAQGDVKLFLKQEVSSVAGPVSSRSSDLILNKREFETTLTVGDGQLLAIGGLLNDDERRTIERIPLLSDIPIIGELFKSRSRSRSKTNLMVFIRPTILRSKEDGDRLTARRYDYVRDMQLIRNPDIEPSIDQLLRDYMGAVPPADPGVRATDIMIGADGNLTRSPAGGPLQSAEVPPSAISTANGDGQ